ncbi:hydrocephalus-inducing protein homolog isoform X2 [Vidua chalybeata]|uniref:hydrocephalus-inducing protein homolog isoform X2 n=1 Tax=Vidua chalybeata TaxID=81927 RepID=UPI0023A8062B|nr:hydrocephalus-inducing protein homolog isoform X2 [Vidua chalybeata]XP_053808758.1 hydrocephalus-inducing protein homolog isoform X2 [Vidua chalybeata]
MQFYCQQGEDTHTSLHGRSVDAHIRLHRNTVTLEKTYITMSNRTTVLIHNHSNITAPFQWKAVDTGEEEDQLELRLCQEEEDKLSYFLKECRVDTTCRECFALPTCSFQTEVAKVRGDPMLFSDDIFCLEPKEGEIGPNCSAEISVSFKPQVYERAVYCNISDVLNAACISCAPPPLGKTLTEMYPEEGRTKFSGIS